MDRRAFLGLGLILPAAALAHDGHGAAGISAEVLAASAGEDGLEVTLSIANGRDVPVTLEAVLTDLGAISAPVPASIAAGGTRDVALVLEAEAWPGIFTLILDFGEAGVGPVTVIPV